MTFMEPSKNRWDCLNDDYVTFDRIPRLGTLICMCGFTGIIEARPQSRNEFQGVLVSMRDALSHRGPDAQGLWMDKQFRIGLAHRRLSIIDLSPEGSQPMRSACGRYVIVYNGEIYNFRKIRCELEKEGGQFRSTSDTEVLLEAIALWGIRRALSRFNGMFAFALWDCHTRELTLARDRIGKKPLYYGWAGSAFVFASELKAIRRHPAFDPTLDPGALTLFLRYNYVPAPWSIYRQIRKLKPGCFVTLSVTLLSQRPHMNDLGDRTQTYWSAAEVVKKGRLFPFQGDETRAMDMLNTLLLDATGSRMISDVPLGALLSGGIDSSLVVSLMQAQSQTPVKTFSLGFEGKKNDEAMHAARIADYLGTDHTEICVTGQDALDVVPLLPDLYDEPFADSSQIPTYLVSKLARSQVTVALSGDGGDELFCGYTRYLRGAKIWRSNTKIPLFLRNALCRALRALPGGGEGENNIVKWTRDLGATTPTDIYLNRISKWRDPTSVVIGGAEPPSPFGALIDQAGGVDATHAMMLIDLVSYLPDDILVKVDRAAMAVSLELRNPILDQRVVEFAWTLPLAMKVKGRRSKHILKEVLARYIPPSYTERPKQGFGSPMRLWLSGPLRGWAEDLLSRERLCREGYFNPEPVRDIWTRFLSGNKKLHPHLWNVLMFQAWLQRQ